MITPVNQDITAQATVSTRKVPPNACVSQALVDAVGAALVVKLPSGQAAQVEVSVDSNNLATLDAANAILVPAIVTWADSLPLAAGASVPLVFSGWPTSMDATVAFMEVRLIVAALEAGTPACVPVSSVPTAIKSIRPSWEYVSILANEVKIAVYHHTSGVNVQLRLAQLPIPPVQA